jgi:uncharacterized protein YggE
MPVTLTPAYRALAMGGAAAAVLIGVFALGIGAGNNAARPSAGQHSPGTNAGALLTSSTGSARITVTGTGTVNGTPSQLVLSIGVQVNAASVGSALTEANQAVSRVTAVLKAGGVAAPDIQTSDLYIQPSFRGGSQTPDGYGVSESLNATLRRLSVAGAEIDDAVRAGGNAATVDGISLNLTDTSSLLARARAAAVADARVKAAQYASALGQPLGPVVSITDQAPSPPFPLSAAGSAAAPHASSSVPISPGTQQLSVSVTVVYAMP